MKKETRFWLVFFLLACIAFVIFLMVARWNDEHNVREVLLGRSSLGETSVLWDEIQTGIVIKELEEVSPSFKLIVVSLGAPVGHENEAFYRSVLVPIDYKVVPKEFIRVKNIAVRLPHEVSDWKILCEDN